MSSGKNSEGNAWSLDIPDEVEIGQLIDNQAIEEVGRGIISCIRNNPGYNILIDIDALPASYLQLNKEQKKQLIEIFNAVNWTVKEENEGRHLRLKLKRKK